MKLWLWILVLLGALQCGAGEIVVLTETPVAEFALPDGSVLTNAYVWRRNSQGLMVMHDGGSYFLNFKLLPDDWKAIYLDPPPEDHSTVAQPAEPEAKAGPVQDRYTVADTLAKIPGLDAAARELLLGADSTGALDTQILLLGALQSLLAGNRDEAKRFVLFLEEKEYELDEVDRELLFRPCANCGGDGHLNKTCKTCNGSGKCPRCEGAGTRKSGFDDARMHCTTCRGTGDCPRCKGAGEFTPPCPKCKGVGKVVNRQYCEILRDRIVREVNAVATPERWVAVTSSASSHIDQVLSKIPTLKEPARLFYLSEEYRGGMDTNLVVACLMHSLLEEDFQEAERFHRMLDVLFPESEVLDAGKYLKLCGKCEATGWIQRDCRSCGGSGKCSRCEGSGERTLEVDGSKVHCTTCRGSGKCTRCQGKGVLKSVCQSCKGRGRVLDRQRTEIKLGLLVDRLNEFYDER